MYYSLGYIDKNVYNLEVLQNMSVLGFTVFVPKSGGIR